MNKYTIEAKRITTYYIITSIEAESAEAARRMFHEKDKAGEIEWTDPKYGKAIVTEVREWTE